MHYGSVPFDMNTLRRGYPTTDNGFCLTPNVTQGRSRGTVRLRIARLPRPGAGRSALLHRPEGYDERIMLAGVRLARTIAEQAPLARVDRPGTGAGTRRDDRRRAARLHPPDATTPSTTRRRTARMGAVDDPMAVLDPQLRVKGVSRLRVVDASAMPKLPAVNPNITVMTMAEKCADLIRGTDLRPMPDLAVVPGRAHAVPVDVAGVELAELARRVVGRAVPRRRGGRRLRGAGARRVWMVCDGAGGAAAPAATAP